MKMIAYLVSDRSGLLWGGVSSGGYCSPYWLELYLRVVLVEVAGKKQKTRMVPRGR